VFEEVERKGSLMSFNEDDTCIPNQCLLRFSKEGIAPKKLPEYSSNRAEVILFFYFNIAFFLFLVYVKSVIYNSLSKLIT